MPRTLLIWMGAAVLGASYLPAASQPSHELSPDSRLATAHASESLLRHLPQRKTENSRPDAG